MAGEHSSQEPSNLLRNSTFQLLPALGHSTLPSKSFSNVLMALHQFNEGLTLIHWALSRLTISSLNFLDRITYLCLLTQFSWTVGMLFLFLVDFSDFGNSPSLAFNIVQFLSLFLCVWASCTMPDTVDKFNTQIDGTRKNYIACCTRELGAGLTISPGLHILIYSTVTEYI